MMDSITPRRQAYIHIQEMQDMVKVPYHCTNRRRRAADLRLPYQNHWEQGTTRALCTRKECIWPSTVDDGAYLFAIHVLVSLMTAFGCKRRWLWMDLDRVRSQAVGWLAYMNIMHNVHKVNLNCINTSTDVNIDFELHQKLNNALLLMAQHS